MIPEREAVGYLKGALAFGEDDHIVVRREFAEALLVAVDKPQGPPNRPVVEGEQPGRKARFWSNPAIVGKTPILTTLLLEGANVGQLWRMWTEHTAAGQSLWAWVSVCFALLLWLNFYRVVTPDEKWAKWMTAFGVLMNLSVCLTVLYFRLLELKIQFP